MRYRNATYIAVSVQDVAVQQRNAIAVAYERTLRGYNWMHLALGHSVLLPWIQTKLS